MVCGDTKLQRAYSSPYAHGLRSFGVVICSLRGSRDNPRDKRFSKIFVFDSSINFLHSDPDKFSGDEDFLLVELTPLPLVSEDPVLPDLPVEPDSPYYNPLQPLLFLLSRMSPTPLSLIPTTLIPILAIRRCYKGVLVGTDARTDSTIFYLLTYFRTNVTVL